MDFWNISRRGISVLPVRKGRGRARRRSRGVAAVEFALVAIPFISLILFVFELSYDLFQQEALDSGLHLAVRQVQTGNAQNATSGTDFITRFLCPNIGGLLTCSNLYVKVQKLSPATGQDFYDFTTGTLPLTRWGTRPHELRQRQLLQHRSGAAHARQRDLHRAVLYRAVHHEHASGQLRRPDGPRNVVDRGRHQRELASHRGRRRFGAVVLKRFRSGRRGTAGLEFALIAPPMILLMIGVYDIAKAVILHQQVINAAHTIPALGQHARRAVGQDDVAHGFAGSADDVGDLR